MTCAACGVEDGHLSDCPARRVATVDGRLERAAELADWVRNDRDVGIMVNAVLSSSGVPSIADLVDQHPGVFDELHETAADLREQAPPNTDPGFLR